MAYLGQKKLGPELITHSQEAWLGYYLFTLFTAVVLAGGFWLVGRAELDPGLHLVAQLGVFILALVSAGIAILCHIAGHLFDELARTHGQGAPPPSETPD